MSRLIVKNLPIYVTDTQLRSHFSKQPSTSSPSSSGGYTLTDARIARKPDGTSRKFGFVGYKTDEEARRARDWWDRTFIGGTRINVEVVEDKHEPRKRTSVNENSPPHARKSSTTDLSKPKDGKPEKKDNQKDKFIAAMTPKSGSRTWADDLLPVPDPTSASASKGDKAKKKKPKGDETTVDAPDDAPQNAAQAPAEDDEARAEGISDLEWMRRRMTTSLADADAEKEFEQSDDEDAPADVQDEPANDVAPGKSAKEVEREQARETILATGRLFLRNLAYTCMAQELQAHFSPFGAIEQVHLPLTPARTPSGLAFITFTNPDDALKAYEAADGGSFQGRLLHVLPAVSKRPASSAPTATGPQSVKDKKLEERKKASAKGWDWAMLYLNPDAVASSVAAKLGVQKSELLHADAEEGGGSAAVKLALAETSVVQETKTFFTSNGVDLGAFERHAAGKGGRSATTLLVKNLPAFTTQQQIRELFEPHGKVAKVLVPPSGAIAVVEMEDESEAGVAWRNVNYRRFGGSIVYLEKGPVGLWKAGGVGSPADGTPAAAQGGKVIALPEEEQPEEAEPGSMLYVKNLSFSTTSRTFSSLFSTLPGFLYARVQTKPNPKDANARLSMGYGFVGFRSREEAERGRRAMDGVECEGHKLSVRFAGRGKEDEESRSGGVTASGDKGEIKLGSRKTAKVIVKNVPFEASRADIRALFQGYGQLKSVRLPTKFDRRTRGFAFLEFTSRKEAENAMAALKHTHLLGRHLVLEWAEEEGVERLREKTKRAYGDGKEIPNKRRKLELGEGGEEDEED